MGAPKWPPKPPNVRRAPAKPVRASITVLGDGGPEMAPQTPQRSSRPGKAGARLDHRFRRWGPRNGPPNPRRSARPGEAVARLDSGPPIFSSRFDHGPFRAAARADAERQRKRPVRPKPVRHHTDLTRRHVDRAGKTVGADEPGVLPEELVDQVVRCIHSLTIRIASRTMSSGPEMRSRAPSRSAVVSRLHCRGEHQVAMVSLRVWRS